MAFPHDGKKFVPGETGNPDGRPRKYVSTLQAQGYKLSEVNDAIQALMSMDLEELKTVAGNPKATVLEVTIAMAIKKSIDRGSLYSIETLLTRVYGKPKELTEATGTQKIIAAASPSIICCLVNWLKRKAITLPLPC